MKFKLSKNLPDVKVGAVGEYDPENGWIEFYIEKDKICYPVNPELYPGWFVPYIFTAEDGVEIYKGDNLFLLLCKDPFVIKDLSPIENLKSHPFKGVNENEFKYFSTKEKAEKYVESLKPNFKVGDIIIDTFQGRNRIGKIDNVEKLDFVKPYVTCENQNTPYVVEHCRKATNDEILSYYTQQGWVKGAKFKYHHTYDKILTIKDIFVRNNKVCIHHAEINVSGLSNSDYSVLFIENCKLVEEPNYPKSWRDLEIKGDVNGFSINVNEVVDYDTFYTQITDSYITENGLHCFSKKSQARSALAFAQLTQLHKATIDEYNRVNKVNWYPDWNDYAKGKWTVVRSENKLKVNSYINTYTNLTFPNKELAEFALVNWKNLWEEYYELNN